MGRWEWDLVTGVCEFDERTARLLGYRSGEDLLEDEGCLDRRRIEDQLHPEDLGRVQAAKQKHRSGCSQDYSIEYRLRTRDGEWRWFLDTGQVVQRDTDGRALRSAGVLTDVHDQHSSVRVESEPQEGTEPELLFPLASSAVVAHRSPVERPEPSDARILVVDDEVVLAELSVRILSCLGFEAVARTSAAMALDLLQAGEHFDLLLTDWMMPEKDGLDLALEARELRPNLPVVLVSGNAAWRRSLALPDLIAADLAKPFGSEELGRAVRKALAESSRGLPEATTPAAAGERPGQV